LPVTGSYDQTPSGPLRIISVRPLTVNSRGVLNPRPWLRGVVQRTVPLTLSSATSAIGAASERLRPAGSAAAPLCAQCGMTGSPCRNGDAGVPQPVSLVKTPNECFQSNLPSTS